MLLFNYLGVFHTNSNRWIIQHLIERQWNEETEKKFSLWKYHSPFSITERVKIVCKCERQRYTKDSDSFRTPLSSSSAFLQVATTPYPYRGELHERLLLWLDCPSDGRLTDWLFCFEVPVCVYTIITPMHSSNTPDCQPKWPPSAILLFTQLEHPVLEIL